ncbi:hypothetical protein [Nocardia araoensis]|uniref:hypothetical protein n=1 Tax=Nocardia araoensis TaxID=228600 RepID=UPI0012F6F222|nr:hypothetical protein [Nocardia araoensis]
MTGRLRTAVTEAGGALQRSVRGISSDIRTIADNLVTADGTGARAISRVAPDTPRLVGQSITGRLHGFTPDEVRSVPILGPDRKVVGVHFPSQLTDLKTPMIFSPVELESARHTYTQWTRGRGSQQPKWVLRGTFPAPWGEETVSASAHADGSGYDVQVKKKIPFTRWSRWVPVWVDGGTYGTILAADKHFKQAVKGAPTAELIQMSCSAAAGSAARESAESLHSAGIGFDVHATEKKYGYIEPGPSRGKQDPGTFIGHSSEVELNESGDTKSPWVKYEAPRQRPNTQD